MKKILVLLVSIAFFSSCFHKEVNIRPEKRITITGKVSTDSGNYLSDIPVISYGSLDHFTSAYESSYLGAGESGDSGDFKFVSLDTYNSFFTVAINPDENDTYHSEYTSVYLMDSLDQHGTYINFDEIKLKKKFPVDLHLENSNSSNEIKFLVSFSPAIETYLIEDRNIGRSFETYFSSNSFEGKLDETNTEEDFSFDYVENTEVSLRYQINGGAVKDTLLNLSETNTFQFEF